MKTWRNKHPLIPENHIQRAPRVNLGSLENCWFTYHQENLIQKFEVQNISTSGIGIQVTKSCPFELNQTYDVILTLGEKKVKAAFRVIFKGRDLMGCAFTQSNPTLAADIFDYLKIQITAHGLNQVDQSFLDPEIKDKATWFTDGKNNEVFFIREEDDISEFQISFLGNHLCGGKHKEFLFGKLTLTDDLEPWISWGEVDSISLRESLPNMAKRFLNQISQLDSETKKLLEKAIDASLKFKSGAP